MTLNEYIEQLTALRDAAPENGELDVRFNSRDVYDVDEANLAGAPCLYAIRDGKNWQPQFIGQPLGVNQPCSIRRAVRIV